jgi:glycosyltransferase involved in cell wall biosynthesis
MNVCTIIARNYGAQARVLAESFLAQHPKSTFSVLVIDGPPLAAGEPYELIEPKQLDIDEDEYLRMAAIYEVMELATAVKPWLLRLLLERGEPVLYLDPDIEVFGPLDEAAELADRHGIVLTPHIAKTVPYESRELVHQTVLHSGIYNLGFIAVSESAVPFLRWWEQRLARECLVAHGEGFFVDQRWADFVPAMFKPHILRDPAWNVAWWNLGHRSFTRTADRYEVDGKPLVFFHYSGYDPHTPHLLSKFLGEVPPILLSQEPSLRQLCDAYACKLFVADLEVFSDQPYAFDTFGAGIRLDRRMRRLYRNALVESEDNGIPKPPNPFSNGGHKFLDWLNEPDDPVGDAHKVSRYLQKVRLEDSELSDRFHDVRWVSADAYLEWVRRHGWRDSGIPREVRRASGNGTRPALEPPTERGINVVGYLRAELGIGEAARMFLRGIETAQIPHTILAYDKTSSRQAHEITAVPAWSPRYDTNLICVNADRVPSFTYDVGPSFFRDRYSIGVWFWELSTFPESMHDAFGVVQEIWVASDFIRASIAAETDLPVLTVPLPVETRTDPGEPPPYAANDRFMFLFSFDFFSGFERKNPLAVVDAFRKAFEPDEGPTLVVKSINGHHELRDLERLRYAARGREDVVVVDEYITAREKDALAARCDCYVSLHRSEGFGLTMAEAMTRGKPVIATGYSGNLEFMDNKNSFLVPFELSETKKSSKPYPSGLEWAEPDIDEAARLMRHVYENPEEARERGARGKMRIRKEHSPQRTAEFIAERLEAIDTPKQHDPAGGRERPAEEGLPGFDAAARYVDAGPEATLADVSPHGRLGGAARRTLFRLLKPYTVRHREFERAVLTAIAALDANIDRLHEEVAEGDAEVFDRIERLERRLSAFEAVTDRALGRLTGGPAYQDPSPPERETR